jgi:hypothetical protein
MFWYLVLCVSHRPSLQDLLRDISRRLKSTLKASAKVRGSGDKVKGLSTSLIAYAALDSGSRSRV